MATASKMRCPDCGIDMNHHADKIDYSKDGVQNDPLGMGGAMQQVHTCPECGKTEMRVEA